MKGAGGRDRRRSRGSFRGEPPASPGTLMVLTISGVLLATAAASMLFNGGNHTDATPHGRLLGTLQEVAEAQESHYRSEGQFTWRAQDLEIDAPASVKLMLTRGDGERWEARARSPEHGLSCVQAGGWSGPAPFRDQPVCYTEES